MNSTSYAFDKPAISNHLALPYFGGQRMPPESVEIYGTGSMYSRPVDMDQFMKALFSDAPLVLRPETRDRMIANHSTNALFDAFSSIQTGLGWDTVADARLAYAGPAQKAIAGLFGWMGADVEAAVLASIQQVELAGYLSALASQASSLLSAAVLITLFVGFLFAERVFFQAKLESLMGEPERAHNVARTVGRIMRRVNHYLLVKAAVSVVTGAAVYGVFKTGGYELALPVAVLTFALNFIPSIGSIIATVIAGLAVYVLTQDAADATGVFAVCGALQFVIGNVIDPMLMGRALRLSSFGIIISLAFWGAVWGLPGMFLAVPIMVALMIICAQSETLRPLAVMLSREGLPDDPPAQG